jgi:hypothetical protein
MIASRNLPFHVKLACDQYELGCSLFCEFTNCNDIFSSGNDLLHHILASGNSSQIHGYLIHSLNFKVSNTTSTFWQVQSTTIAQLRSLRNLQLVVAIIIPDHDGHCVKHFARTLKAVGWFISQSDDVSFPSIGDTIAGSCNLLFRVHSSCTACIEPFELQSPPPLPPCPLGAFLWKPFNKPEHSVSLACNDDNFCHQDIWFTATAPSGKTPLPQGSLSGIFSTGTVQTRALSVAQLLSLLIACAHHLMLAQIRTCFNISLVLNFISKVIAMCAESQHLSLLGVLGLLTTLLISYLTRRANLPSTPEFLDTLWLGSLSRFTPIWFLCGI